MVSWKNIIKWDKIHKIILFVSSYIPLYLLLIAKDIVGRLEHYGLKSLKNFYKINSLNDIMILILLFFILTSFFYLRHMLKTATKGAYIKIKEIKDETSTNFLNYISIYFLSCIGLSLGSYEDVVVLVIVMFIIGYIYTSSNLVYINPILHLLGYGIYNMEGTDKGTGKDVSTLLVAKRTLCLKKGDQISSTKITSFALALEKKNPSE